jgi:hypothetical protein
MSSTSSRITRREVLRAAGLTTAALGTLAIRSDVRAAVGEDVSELAEPKSEKILRVATLMWSAFERGVRNRRIAQGTIGEAWQRSGPPLIRTLECWPDFDVHPASIECGFLCGEYGRDESGWFGPVEVEHFATAWERVKAERGPIMCRAKKLYDQDGNLASHVGMGC